MDNDLDLSVHKTEDVSVVDLSGDVDEFTCPKLRDALRGLVSGGESRIVISLAGVNYMDSSGLGTLVGGLRRIAEQNGGLALSGPNPQIQKVLSITGLSRILTLHEDEASAVESLKTKTSE